MSGRLIFESRPNFVTSILADVGRSGANVINERADNMALYDDVEDTSLDLYAAVRKRLPTAPALGDRRCHLRPRPNLAIHLATLRTPV
jgi:hypothetical protein